MRRRPYVVAHVAVSLDGATRGFDADIGRFYELAGTWHEDVTLTGADTVLAQEEALRAAPGSGPAAEGAVLAVVDSRGRVTEWEGLRNAGYWTDVVALRSLATPPRPGDRSVEELVVGSHHVDLRAALEALGERYGAGVVRVDSGGALLGALLTDGLVDEVSLLVHPSWTSDRGHLWHGSTPSAAAGLDLVDVQRLDRLVWVRYRFSRQDQQCRRP